MISSEHKVGPVSMLSMVRHTTTIPKSGNNLALKSTNQAKHTKKMSVSQALV